MAVSSLSAVVLTTLAYSNGILGFSGIVDGDSCRSCHGGTGNEPTVTITGPSQLDGGQTGQYLLTITGGPGVRAGMNVAVDRDGATLAPGNGNSKRTGTELHHVDPVGFSGGQVTFPFSLVAPSTGGTLTLFAAGLSANGANGSGGDRDDTATLSVTVVAQNAPPTVAEEAAASAEPVTGKTVTLTARGADDGGEAALRYTWSKLSDAGDVAFSSNGDNAAKSTVVTFTEQGSYAFRVTVTDGADQSAQSEVPVTVLATPQIEVTPAVATVAPGAEARFEATLADQFGVPFDAEVSWSVSGGGAITHAGLFTAGPDEGGPHHVLASADGRVGSAQVTVSHGEGGVALGSAFVGGTVLKGTVTLAAEVADHVDAREVTFHLGDSQVGTATRAPWQVEVDTTPFPNGTYLLRAVVTDAGGRVLQTPPVAVKVQNESAEAVGGEVGCAAAPGSTVHVFGWAVVGVVSLFLVGSRRRARR